jgi:response regulator RpfG family c-di-GMP phosphodiesterase
MNKKILAVDDEYEVLSGYRRNLRKYFNLTLATGAEEALEEFRSSGPFAAVITDFRMPGTNGIELLEKIQKIEPDTSRILITGFANLDMAIKSVNTGHVFRFLTKPIAKEDLLAVLNEATEQYRLLKSEKELLEKTLKGTIKILIEILSAIYPDVFEKSNRARELSRKIALKTGYKKLWEVEIGALLAQVGLITVPAEIISKKVNQVDLSHEESSILENYTENGMRLLQNIPRLENIANAIRYLEIPFDEYKRISKTDDDKGLPILSRILKIAFDYEEEIDSTGDKNEALKSLLKKSDKYDPALLSALEEIIRGTGAIYKTISIPFRKLRVNMVLADDIRDKEGNLLIKNGTEITDLILMRIANMAKFRQIAEPLLVNERKDESSL